MPASGDTGLCPQMVERTSFSASVPGGELVGWVSGDGPPVLLLHGGPGMSYDYLDTLVDDLGDGYRIACYQQRGLEPSTSEGPFDLATQTDDVVAVLDALGWNRAYVVGHSWGGHLSIQLARRRPDRLLGVLVLDPLGAVGDGGAAEFEAEMFARTPAEDRERAQKLDEQAMAGEGTVDAAMESLRMVWPAYFADPANVMPFELQGLSVDAYSATWAELQADLPALAESLPGLEVPMTFVHGGASPMPVSASADTVARLPNAELIVLENAGHMLWFERPGAVGEALGALVERSGGNTTS